MNSPCLPLPLLTTLAVIIHTCYTAPATAQQPTVLAVLKGHQRHVTTVLFSPDGKQLITGSGDKTVRIWDVSQGKQTRVIQGHTPIAAVAISPDGNRLAFGGRRYTHKKDDETTVRVTDLTGKQELVLPFFRAESIAFSPNGTSLVVAGGSDIKLWDLTTGEQQLAIGANPIGVDVGIAVSKDVHYVVFSPNGKMLITGSGDHTIRLWDTADGKELLRFIEPAESVLGVAISPDGKLVASASTDVSVWDLEARKRVAVLKGHDRYSWRVTFSPDGKLLASASTDHTVRVWDVHSGECKHVLRGHEEMVTSVCFSPDSKTLASSSYDKTVRLWDLGGNAALPD